MANPENIKLAVVQASPVMFDTEKTLERVEEYTREASSEGAGLVLFPESFIPCYPRGEGFGAVVGNRSDEGRSRWQAFNEASVEVPGPITDRLGKLARELSVYLVIGVTERSRIRHTLYCCLLYFAPDGSLMGKHRKIKPTASERLIWGEGRGDDLDVYETPFGRMGGLICWENYMPLARMALYRQGITLYLAPTADARDTWQATLRHIACEGRCMVIGANQFVSQEDYPRDWNWDPEIAYSRGGSAIIGPFGEYLAGPLFDESGILYADMDIGKIIRSRMDFDVDGHYQRPDLFSFKWMKPDREE